MFMTGFCAVIYRLVGRHIHENKQIQSRSMVVLNILNLLIKTKFHKNNYLTHEMFCSTYTKLVLYYVTIQLQDYYLVRLCFREQTF